MTRSDVLVDADWVEDHLGDPGVVRRVPEARGPARHGYHQGVPLRRDLLPGEPVDAQLRTVTNRHAPETASSSCSPHLEAT